MDNIDSSSGWIWHWKFN